MRLRIAAARQGATWVVDGFKAFGRHPLALASLFFFGMMVIGILGAIPLIGAVLSFAFIPLLLLAMMVGGALSAQNQSPSLPAVLNALRMDPPRRNAFVVLGLLFTAGIALAAALTSLLDGGQFARIFLLGEQAKREVLLQPDVQSAAFAFMTLYLLLNVLIWHAPGLIYWHRVPAIKAVFFSAVACFRNVPAFLVYGLVWMAITIGFGLACSLVAVAGGMTAGVMMMLLGSLVLSIVYLVSVVFSFRDCFEAPEALPPTDGF